MLFKNVICAGILGTGATIVMAQSIASAKTPVEIASIAKNITILITGNNSQGSGVIIQRQGDIYTVLTAAHVVDLNAKYRITTPDDRQYQIIDNLVRSLPIISIWQWLNFDLVLTIRSRNLAILICSNQGWICM
jgi:hypothetical protein